MQRPAVKRVDQGTFPFEQASEESPSPIEVTAVRTGTDHGYDDRSRADADWPDGEVAAATVGRRLAPLMLAARRHG